MVVGVVRVELHIHGATSLKERRAVVRSIRDRLRARHNISVAEVDAQDVWQRATLGIAAVSLTDDRAARLLAQLRSEVEDLLPGGILAWEEEILDGTGRGPEEAA